MPLQNYCPNPGCNFRSERRDTMERHILNLHGEPKVCDKCARVFRSMEHYVRHVKICGVWVKCKECHVDILKASSHFKEKGRMHQFSAYWQLAYYLGWGCQIQPNWFSPRPKLFVATKYVIYESKWFLLQNLSFFFFKVHKEAILLSFLEEILPPTQNLSRISLQNIIASRFCGQCLTIFTSKEAQFY